MAKESLAVKYRPRKFNEISGQEAIKKILNYQVSQNNVKRVLLFTGPAGCGKTTSGRIFANELEPCKSNIIELNCADKNGVDDVREFVIKPAKNKPLQGKIKVFILDEVHMLTPQSQNALLKLLEEPPAYCIFILCTTDPQKILGTILSRAYRYDFQKIAFNDIVSRLNYILETEKNEGANIVAWDQDAIAYIARTSSGHMRDAITLTDKILSYTNNITINDVITVLGITGYDIQFDLLHALAYKDQEKLLNNLDNLYKSGKDLKLFTKNFLTFVLEVNKFIIVRNFNMINIPSTYETRLIEASSIDRSYIKQLLTTLVRLNSDLKWETNPKTVLESTLLLEVL